MFRCNFLKPSKYINFKINITEKNFNLVGYYETPSKKKSITTLCKKLKNGICDIETSFKNGNHTLICQELFFRKLPTLVREKEKTILEHAQEPKHAIHFSVWFLTIEARDKAGLSANRTINFETTR